MLGDRLFLSPKRLFGDTSSLNLVAGPNKRVDSLCKVSTYHELDQTYSSGYFAASNLADIKVELSDTRSQRCDMSMRYVTRCNS